MSHGVSCIACVGVLVATIVVPFNASPAYAVPDSLSVLCGNAYTPPPPGVLQPGEDSPYSPPTGSLASREAQCQAGGVAFAVETIKRGARQQSPARAQALLNAALRNVEGTNGPNDKQVALLLIALGDVLESEDLLTDAEPLYRRASSIASMQGVEDPSFWMSDVVGKLEDNLKAQGRSREAELVGQQRKREFDEHQARHYVELPRRGVTSVPGVYSVDSTNLREPTETEKTRINELWREIANAENAEDWIETDAPYRELLTILGSTDGPQHEDTSAVMQSYAAALAHLDRFDEANSLSAQARAIDDGVAKVKLAGRRAGIDTFARRYFQRAQIYQSEGRYAEQEQELRAALPLTQAAWAEGAVGGANTRDLIAKSLLYQGKLSEAEQTERDAFSSLFCRGGQASAGRETGPCATTNIGPSTATLSGAVPASILFDLGVVLAREGQSQAAEQMYKFAKSLAVPRSIYASDVEPARMVQYLAARNLGLLYRGEGRFQESSAEFAIACPGLEVRKAAGSRGVLAGREFSDTTNHGDTCELEWMDTLLRLGPQRLNGVRAFELAQAAQQSGVGSAMARMTARAAAATKNAGPQADAYERAIAQRLALSQQFSAAPGRFAPTSTAGRASGDAVMLDEQIAQLSESLIARFPRYWDFRSPAPISVADLQANTGDDAKLLHNSEVLIEIFIPPGDAHGFVFAVSKDRFAWARLGLGGSEIASIVTTLRGELDDPHAPRAFERQLAHDLYNGLFGDAGIQSVVSARATWLIAADDPLTSLPLGVLITAPPVGGSEGDADPNTLRDTTKTGWLLRTKSIVVLPAVSSLRTLRQILPQSRRPPTDPFLGFADPEFHSGPVPTPSPAQRPTSPRSLAAYYRNGDLGLLADELIDLPGTRDEGLALQQSLGGRPGSLLIGRDATKAALFARDGDGRLSNVRILEFATHGLLTGDVEGLGEPALVLARGARPLDMLLTTSEIATLHLHADWVLLSACNTAGPDKPGAPGLTGLARAFIYAGASSLLVSHWPVRDDVASKLVPSIFAIQSAQNVTKADALRLASLAILDDPGLSDAARPGAWAPFSLVGEGQ